MIEPLYKNNRDFKFVNPFVCDAELHEIYTIYNTNDNKIYLENYEKTHKQELKGSCTSNVLGILRNNILYVLQGSCNIENLKTEKYKNLYELKDVFKLTKRYILIINDSYTNYLISNSYFENHIIESKPTIKEMKISKTSKPEIYIVNDGDDGVLYIPNIECSKFIRIKLNTDQNGLFQCKFNTHFNKWQLL